MITKSLHELKSNVNQVGLLYCMYVVIILSCMGATSAAGQNWDRYIPRSLTTIIHDEERAVKELLSDSAVSKAGNNSPNFVISAVDFATKAHVIYTGQHRPLSPEKTMLISLYMKSFSIDSSKAPVFVNEYLFREDSSDLWLAVQRVLEEPLSQEARCDQAISVFVTYIGAYRLPGRDISLLFLVNEFDAQSEEQTSRVKEEQPRRVK